MGVVTHQSPVRAVGNEDWYIGILGYQFLFEFDTIMTEMYWNFTLLTDYTSAEAMISLEYTAQSDAANRFWHNYTFPRTQVKLYRQHKC